MVHQVILTKHEHKRYAWSWSVCVCGYYPDGSDLNFTSPGRWRDMRACIEGARLWLIQQGMTLAEAD